MKEQKIIFKRDKILKALKEDVRLPTTSIGYRIGMNPINCKKLLIEMETEGILIQEKETLATYWRLKAK